MNNTKGFIPLALLIILLLIGGVGYYLYSQGLMNQIFPTPSSQTPPQINLNQAEVTITEDGFIPNTVRIKKGQAVEWTNTDIKPHQVAPDPHPAHTSLPELAQTDPIESDESISFIFEKTGTFTYHDHLNPLKSKGAVMVE